MERFSLIRKEQKGYDEMERRILRKASPGICPGLSRISRLLRILGNPEKAIPVVHLAGTNGKGSTGAFLERIFRAAGYATGFYTSPHLLALGERFLVRGVPLPASAWCRAWEKTEKALGEIPSSEVPSYFEILTALAFLMAVSSGVEVLILEAGMGGRFDATNVSAPVKASVITTIGMDHQEYLGNTLEEIGEEKFAILRPRSFATFRGGIPFLEENFLRRARKVGARGHLFSRNCVLSEMKTTSEGSLFSFAEGELFLSSVALSLRGKHQVENGAHALSAAWHLRESFPAIRKEHLLQGLRETSWPFRGSLFPGEPPLFVDGVHNPEGAGAFAAMVQERWKDCPGKVLVFSCMKDKDFSQMLDLLRGCASHIICTSVPGMERSASAEILEKTARSRGWTSCESCASPLEALNRAKARGNLVLLGGSLYLLGYLLSKGAFPLP
ncbi:MAG TPA: folylpolyglutamate synthase/dihydrofolate synthase family protein [Synergistaceae bacterium]|nr:folylpolyglutamate synthase/dihydrofolate synthase family protein [Synergistaceae bacterium]HPQ36573.1 folylpolyglutamate synthase/dihydrofolate synthase family protein [Synergistaceae bacterium]